MYLLDGVLPASLPNYGGTGARRPDAASATAVSSHAARNKHLIPGAAITQSYSRRFVTPDLPPHCGHVTALESTAMACSASFSSGSPSRPGALTVISSPAVHPARQQQAPEDT